MNKEIWRAHNIDRPSVRTTLVVFGNNIRQPCVLDALGPFIREESTGEKRPHVGGRRL